MESIQSKLVKVVLRIIKWKKMWQLTGEELRNKVEKKQLSESAEPPKEMKNKYNIIQKKINGHDYYIIEPLNDAGQKHILFLHGGGYVYEITSLHWEFLGNLCDALRCKITVPVYPLAPKHNHKDVFDMLVPLYKQLIAGINTEDLVIMGDSSGGGMSLALAMLLKEKGMQQPGDIILISPALDWTFSNPEIYDVEKTDLLLAVPALLEIGKWYGGEEGIKHYLISPIYGDFQGLGEISLFIGTNDILYPDARRLKKMIDEKGIKINYFEYPSMIHIWPLYFFPESKRATEQIIQIIN